MGRASLERSTINQGGRYAVTIMVAWRATEYCVGLVGFRDYCVLDRC